MDLSWHYIMQRQEDVQEVGVASQSVRSSYRSMVEKEARRGLSVGRSVLMNLCQSGAQSLLKLHTTPQWNWFPFDQRGEFSFPGEIPMPCSPPSSFLSCLPCLSFSGTLFRLWELNEIIQHPLATTSLLSSSLSFSSRVITAEWTKKNILEGSVDAFKLKIISKLKSLPRSFWYWSVEWNWFSAFDE